MLCFWNDKKRKIIGKFSSNFSFFVIKGGNKMENEVESVVEYGLLDKAFLAQYDLVQTEKNVNDIIMKFLKSQYKYLGIQPPRMTTNYEIVYAIVVNNCYDKVGKYVADKLDTKQDIINFYNVMAGAIERMNTYERVYYTEFLLNKKSERYTADRIGVSRNGMIPIRNSCILKIAMAFGKEVEI